MEIEPRIVNDNTKETTIFQEVEVGFGSTVVEKNNFLVVTAEVAGRNLAFAVKELEQVFLELLNVVQEDVQVENFTMVD